MAKKRAKKSSKKRKPSAYNAFISAERKKGRTMAEAARAWKEKKARETHPHLPSRMAVKKTSVKKTSSAALERTLTQNLVALQKINVDLAEKFDSLSKQISQLLSLFEITAKSFAKTAPLGEYEKDKDFLSKIDKLLDQNKTLAKGLTLMEERLRERVYGHNPLPSPREREGETRVGSPVERPLPRF